MKQASKYLGATPFRTELSRGSERLCTSTSKQHLSPVEHDQTPSRASPPGGEFMRIDLPDETGGRKPSELDISPQTVTYLTHYYTEQARLDDGAGLLRFDDELARIAVAHSRDMRTREYLGHHSPEGHDVGSRLDRFDYTPPTAEKRGGVRFGENIARNAYRVPVQTDGRRINQSADEVASHIVDQWLDSPGHRENLLDAGWVREGIGVALHPHRSGALVFITQVFSDA